jgi:hypothetical protein
MNIEKLKETIKQIIPASENQIKFQIIIKDYYRSWEPLSLDDLICSEDLLEKINHYLSLGAKLEFLSEDTFEDEDDLVSYIYDNEAYINIADAEDVKEKNHQLILNFLAPLEILDNQEFQKMMSNKEIKAFIFKINGFKIKIEV